MSGPSESGLLGLGFGEKDGELESPRRRRVCCFVVRRWRRSRSRSGLVGWRWAEIVWLGTEKEREVALGQSADALRGSRDGGDGGRKPAYWPGTDRGRGGSADQDGYVVGKPVGDGDEAMGVGRVIRGDTTERRDKTGGGGGGGTSLSKSDIGGRRWSM